MRQSSRLLATMALAVAVSACSPWVVRLQPSLRVLVHDSDGAPVPGAVLHLARLPLCFGCLGRAFWLDTYTADAQGLAAVERQREVQFVIWAPDAGPRYYAWAWCVDAPGYAPVIQERLPDPPGEVVVSLQHSTDHKVCGWDGHLHFVEAAPGA